MKLNSNQKSNAKKMQKKNDTILLHTIENKWISVNPFIIVKYYRTILSNRRINEYEKNGLFKNRDSNQQELDSHLIH